MLKPHFKVYIQIVANKIALMLPNANQTGIKFYQYNK